MELKKIFSILVISLTVFTAIIVHAEPIQLLNVSYDPTLKLYQDYNKVFIQYWRGKTGQTIQVRQSHGGSGRQALAIINGLPADVATLALAYDIDILAKNGKLLPLDWQKQLPNNSCPYTSTILFVVKKGNPKHIHDWSDLIRPGMQVIMPNPKTSGGARWSYLAAWSYALKKNNGNEEAAKAFIQQLYKHVPILSTGARDATIAFSQRGIGDVLIAWENEALLITHKLGDNKFEVVTPSISILAEPPVAVVDHNTKLKGTTTIAKAYLEYLYTQKAQELIAQHYYRPVDPIVAKHYAYLFPQLSLVTIQDLGGWESVQKKHFANNGIFDQIYQHK